MDVHLHNLERRSLVNQQEARKTYERDGEYGKEALIESNSFETRQFVEFAHVWCGYEEYERRESLFLLYNRALIACLDDEVLFTLLTETPFLELLLKYFYNDDSAHAKLAIKLGNLISQESSVAVSIIVKNRYLDELSQLRTLSPVYFTFLDDLIDIFTTIASDSPTGREYLQSLPVISFIRDFASIIDNYSVLPLVRLIHSLVEYPNPQNEEETIFYFLEISHTFFADTLRAQTTESDQREAQFLICQVVFYALKHTPYTITQTPLYQAILTNMSSLCTEAISPVMDILSLTIQEALHHIDYFFVMKQLFSDEVHNVRSALRLLLELVTKSPAICQDLTEIHTKLLSFVDSHDSDNQITSLLLISHIILESPSIPSAFLESTFVSSLEDALNLDSLTPDQTTLVQRAIEILMCL